MLGCITSVLASQNLAKEIGWNMSEQMEPLIFLITGAALMAIADKMIRFWASLEERREIANSNKVLAAHGMSAHLYVPSMGIDSRDLKSALEKSASSGKIVLDSDGRVIGKVLPNIVKGKNQPKLQLVVDNTKKE